MRSVLTAIALFCSSPAFATGGFGCQADDAGASFIIDALTTRGMGYPVLRFDSEVSFKDGEVAADLRTSRFDVSHLAQYWAEDGELRLLIYRERTGDGPYAHVQLIVRARFDEKDDLTGRYTLEVVDATGGEARTLTVEGDVSCVIG